MPDDLYEQYLVMLGQSGIDVNSVEGLIRFAQALKVDLSSHEMMQLRDFANRVRSPSAEETVIVAFAVRKLQGLRR